MKDVLKPVKGGRNSDCPQREAWAFWSVGDKHGGLNKDRDNNNNNNRAKKKTVWTIKRTVWTIKNPACPNVPICRWALNCMASDWYRIGSVAKVTAHVTKLEIRLSALRKQKQWLVKPFPVGEHWVLLRVGATEQKWLILPASKSLGRTTDYIQQFS